MPSHSRNDLRINVLRIKPTREPRAATRRRAKMCGLARRDEIRPRMRHRTFAGMTSGESSLVELSRPTRSRFAKFCIQSAYKLHINAIPPRVLPFSFSRWHSFRHDRRCDRVAGSGERSRWAPIRRSRVSALYLVNVCVTRAGVTRESGRAVIAPT